MKYLIKDINKIEKRLLESMGLYCYDLRESDNTDEIANVEKRVFVNKIGNMVTNEKIDFERIPNDFVNYFDFCMNNDKVEKIDELIGNENFDIDNILNATAEVIEKDGKFDDLEVRYILVDNKDKNNSIVVVMREDELFEIIPFKKEMKEIDVWEYNFDIDILGKLERNQEIAYMGMPVHLGIWEIINEWYPNSIECKIGMQKYLKYCKDNKITKEVIEKATKLDNVNDAMKYYKKDRTKRKEAR